MKDTHLRTKPWLASCAPYIPAWYDWDTFRSEERPCSKFPEYIKHVESPPLCSCLIQFSLPGSCSKAAPTWLHLLWFLFGSSLTLEASDDSDSFLSFAGAQCHTKRFGPFLKNAIAQQEISRFSVSDLPRPCAARA